MYEALLLTLRVNYWHHKGLDRATIERETRRLRQGTRDAAGAAEVGAIPQHGGGHAHEPDVGRLVRRRQPDHLQVDRAVDHRDARALLSSVGAGSSNATPRPPVCLRGLWNMPTSPSCRRSRATTRRRRLLPSCVSGGSPRSSCRPNRSRPHPAHLAPGARHQHRRRELDGADRHRRLGRRAARRLELPGHTTTERLRRARRAVARALRPRPRARAPRPARRAAWRPA